MFNQVEEMANMNHTPTPYKVIDGRLVAAVTENKITVVADCNNPKNMPVADA